MAKSLILVILCTVSLYASRIDRNLQNFIQQNPQQNVKIWIFFNDKGKVKDLSFSKEINRISARAIKRRSKIDKQNIIKFTDYPVNIRYINVVKNYVIKIRHVSRWLNAVSAVIQTDKVKMLDKLDCVRQIRYLRTYKRRIIKDKTVSFNKSISAQQDSSEYGFSLTQLNQIGVIYLHQQGLTGKGVVIGMLDDGFNQYDTHITFDSLNVLDTYDFVNNDVSVADRDSIPRQGWHGTQTLSVIGGYTPGKLIGSAYKAGFLLAKTEIDAKEIQQEEDNWVAGLEWEEAKGADIVSSSLGYFDFDHGIGNYTWEDMDGETAVTTLATNIADSLGLIVVNSAGNEGITRHSYPNSLIAPADGKYVITVGGCDSTGSYWSTSSFGPTADGRIKPDVCALGTGVYHASDYNTAGFDYGSGTSFSAPLTAGAIALLIEAFPYLTPQQVRNVIRQTASQAGSPDNYLGYGVLNISAAYQYILTNIAPLNIVDNTSPVTSLNSYSAPNPFSDYTRIQYSVHTPSIVSVTIYNILGQEVLKFSPQMVYNNDYKIITGRQLGTSGIYFYRIEGKEYNSGKSIQKKGRFLFVKE